MSKDRQGLGFGGIDMVRAPINQPKSTVERLCLAKGTKPVAKAYQEDCQIRANFIDLAPNLLKSYPPRHMLHGAYV